MSLKSATPNLRVYFSGAIHDGEVGERGGCAARTRTGHRVVVVGSGYHKRVVQAKRRELVTYFVKTITFKGK